MKVSKSGIITKGVEKANHCIVEWMAALPPRVHKPGLNHSVWFNNKWLYNWEHFLHSVKQHISEIYAVSVRAATIDILYTLDGASNYSAIQKLKP
jgi:hypothetical protein